MDNPLPRIAVAGAGSVGCFVGGQLQQHAAVTLIGRARVELLLNEHGLRLTDLDGGERKVTPESVYFTTDMQAAASAELVLVTVKSGGVEAVARQLAPVLADDAVVLSLQNGVRNVDLLRRELSRQVVLPGMVGFNVVHRGQGWLHRATAGGLMAARHPALERFRPAFAGAGMALQLRDDMLAVQWAKLLFNLNNAINALSDLPLRDQLARRDYRRCLALLQSEALKVLAAAGIKPARLSAVPPRLMPLLLRLPTWLFRLLARSDLSVGPLARSSTWEDLTAGRPTEVDYLNGEVVALAVEHQLDAPANARIVELVHAAENGDQQVWRKHALWHELQRALAEV